MKILFLSQRFIFPMDTGGKIRTGNILKELCKLADVTVISNVEHPKDSSYIDEMTRLCHKFVEVPWQEQERYTLWFFAKLAIQSLSQYPVAALNDYSKDLERALIKELSEADYDLVICDFLQSTLNCERIAGIPTLLFQHNVEAQISMRHVDNATNAFSRLFWSLQHKRTLKLEKRMCQRFDATIAVSEEDRQLMRKWYGAENVYAIPTGVDTTFFAPKSLPTKPKQLVFTGSMDWLPNDDAMAWFIEDILPRIRTKEPDTTLVIVGRKPTPRIEKLVRERAYVSLTGWVDDIRDYIAESAVYVVPIRIGGGTRIKIYEGLSMAKAMVTTTVGAEGLPLEHGKHVMRADSAEDFATSVIKLLKDDEMRQRLGADAHEYVNEHYRWEKVAQIFLKVCEQTTQQCNS